MAQIQGSGLTPSTQGVWGLQGNSGQNNWLGTSDSTDLIFKVNSQERLRLQTDGTITANGILHTNRLKVEGLAELDSVRTVHIRANRISSQNPGDTLIFFGDNSIVMDHSNDHIYAVHSNGTKDIRIQCQGFLLPGQGGTNHTMFNSTRGNVGIGVGNYGTLPTEKLHVNGNTVITGNLGVGTTSPQYKLDVRKTGGDYALRVQSNGTVIAGQLTGSGSTARMYFGDGNHYIGSKFGEGVKIGTYGATDIIQIWEGSYHPDGKGKISIGPKRVTSGPHTEFRLSVDGKIVAKEIVVTTDANYWADFVFEEDYNLRPLSEVKTYIKKNGHLPDVPSANEVAAQGQDLGRMNAVLLQKVEELTLYIIQLESRLTEVEQSRVF